MSGTTETPHSILGRQLSRLGLSVDELPNDASVWRELLAAIQGYYETLESSQNRLEQRLRESAQRSSILEESIHELQGRISEQSQEHYQNVFERTPVPTWEENFARAAVWLENLRMSGVEDLESHFVQNPDDLRSAVALVEVTNVNQAAARLVGAEEEAVLLGPLDPDLVDRQSAPAFIAQLKGIWESSDAIRTSLTGTTISGAIFDGILEWHAPRVFGSPDYSRVLVTIVDITEQKDAERKARERLKSKDEFIASVSHELRTPLTSVLGFAELLRSMDEGDYSEERDALLGIISSQAADLSDLVEDLLVTARFELGQLSIAEVPVNVHAQIAQVLEARTPEDEQIRAPLRPSQAVMASGDPHRVRQILRNLITNANRHGGPDIAIEVEGTPETVAISVIDNGDGLEPGQEDRVFEKYARNTDDAHPDSVGLGLTIARDLARRMNGDLTYGRQEGWTFFTLILPALIQTQTGK